MWKLESKIFVFGLILFLFLFLYFVVKVSEGVGFILRKIDKILI